MACPQQSTAPKSLCHPFSQYYFDQLSRRNFVLASLIATGTLWDNDGLNTPVPYMVARFVDRGQEAYIQVRGPGD